MKSFINVFALSLAVIVMLQTNASPAKNCECDTLPAQIAGPSHLSHYDTHVPFEEQVSNLNLGEKESRKERGRFRKGLGKLARKLRGSKPKQSEAISSTLDDGQYSDEQQDWNGSDWSMAAYQGSPSHTQGDSYGHKYKDIAVQDELPEDIRQILQTHLRVSKPTEPLEPWDRLSSYARPAINEGRGFAIEKSVADINCILDVYSHRYPKDGYLWQRATKQFVKKGDDQRIDVVATLSKWMKEGVHFGDPDPQLEPMLPMDIRAGIWNHLRGYLATTDTVLPIYRALQMQGVVAHDHTDPPHPLARAVNLHSAYGNLVTAVALASENEELHKMAGEYLVEADNKFKESGFGRV